MDSNHNKNIPRFLLSHSLSVLVPNILQDIILAHDIRLNAKLDFILRLISININTALSFISIYFFSKRGV